MPGADIRGVFADMRAAQRAITAACVARPEGWRHDVVRHRRALADLIGRLSTLIGGDEAATSPATGTALSTLRAALAGHQASWPAVSIDTASPDYRASVGRVRAAFDALERAIRPADGSLPPSGD